MKQLILAATVAAFLALDVSAKDDTATDYRTLQEAVQKVDLASARLAIDRLAGADSRKGVEALSKAHTVASSTLMSLKQSSNKKNDERITTLDEICRAIRGSFSSMNSADSADAMMKTLKGRGDPFLCAAMARALGSGDGEDILPFLVQQVSRERSTLVKIALLEALGRRRPSGDDDIAKISGLLKDRAWQVVVACAECLGAIGSLKAVEPLVKALDEAEHRVRTEINRALVSLTGVNKHGDHAAWKDWLDTNKEAITSGTFSKKEDLVEKMDGKAPQGTTFYGIPLTSKNLIFVIDRSSSMNRKTEWKPEPYEDVATGARAGANPLQGLKPNGDRRWDIAVFELKKVLLTLPERTKFNIVFYDAGMFELMENRMIVMTSASRAEAIRKLDKTNTGRGTNISGGLERAFRLVLPPGAKDIPPDSADTIYLLSDGSPSKGITNPEKFIEWMGGENGNLKLVINTISIGQDSALMKDIAEKTGGKYIRR